MQPAASLVPKSELSPPCPFARLLPSLVAIAFVFASLALLGIELTRGSGRIATLWLPNAVLTGVLLQRQPRNTWPYLAACLGADVVVNLTVGDPILLAIGLAVVNMIEVAMLVWIMRRLCGPLPAIDETRTLGHLLLACLLATSASATLATLALAPWAGRFDTSAWLTWMLADGMSLLIVTPLMMISVQGWRSRQRPSGKSVLEWAGFLALATLVTVLIFAQSRFPFLFLACPVVIMAAFRKGIVGTAAATAIISLVASGFTMAGIGPITLVKGSAGDQLIALQLFLATSFAMGLPVATSLAAREALRRELRESRDFVQSILDNVDEVIFKTDKTGRWTFLNPAWEQLTGYRVEQSLGWSTTKLLHRDDLAEAGATYPKIVSGEIDACTLHQRFSTIAGDCRHIEVIVRRIQDEHGSFQGTAGNIRDVTSSVLQDQALRESERLHRLLAEHSNDMIVRMALDGTRRYVSPACRKVLGFEPEQMIGSVPVGAIHADDRARVVDVCRTLLSGADNPICTYRQQHREGHYVWLEASCHLIRDDCGDPIEFVASVRDVSRRQEVELEATEAAARLQESHRMFTMASALTHIGHWRVDLVRQEVVWSHEVYRLHGVGPECAPTLESAIDSYHPDDRERVSALVAGAIETGKDFEFTAVLLRPDGNIRHVISRGQAERAPDGSVIGLFGVIQDISEQVAAEAAVRSSERMHRLLAEASSDIIVRFALDGTPLYVSPASHTVLGFEPDELMTRGAVRDIHPDDRAHVLDAWTGVLRGESSKICLYRQRRHDGQEVWLEAAYRLADAEATSGEPEVVATVRDVTRRRHAELATAEAAERLQGTNLMLIEARERAEAAAHSVTNFLADMSHEIRTPMNGVVGFTDLLLAGELSDDQRRRAELIAESGRSMVRLLNDILDLSKIEARQMTVAADPYNLAHALGACEKLVRPAIEQKGIDLRCDLSDALPKAVLGDGLRVRQVVLNLLGNAAKFTQEGSITLRARINRQAGGAVLSISVEDTGIGIAPDRQAAIFEEFVQADASIAPRFGGTGLGLSISARLARLMGGELRLESEPGRGSCFILILPLTPATEQSVDAAKAIEADAPRSVLNHAAHVLVAEDHDINQCLIADMLDRLDCRHALAANGREAVEMVAQAAAAGDPYSIVLMDMQMPEMDGLEATRRLRAAGFGAMALPVVALTANAYAEDVAACLDAGMQAHLGKPVTLSDLTATLRRWTGAPAPLANATRFSPGLHAKYQERKAETLMRLDELVSRGDFGDATVSGVAELLHKLAGTAAMFGEPEVGERARVLENDLLRWPKTERAEKLPAAVAQMKLAA